MATTDAPVSSGSSIPDPPEVPGSGAQAAPRRPHLRPSGPSARTSGPGWIPLAPRGWQGYAVAVVVIAVAVGLTQLLHPILQRTLGTFFFAAITFVAWYGGLGPALLATLLSVVTLDYFFIDPTHRWSIGRADLPTLVIFAAVGAFVSWLSHSLRRAEARARRHTDALEEARALLEEQTYELQRSRDFLEEAQRSAQLGSWERDVRTDANTWSDEMYRVYGLEVGTPVERDTIRRFIHPDDRARIDGVLEESMRTGAPFTFEHRIMRPDRSVRWVRGRGRPVRDERGQLVRMVGSAQDITESHRAEDAQRLLADASEALASSLDYGVTLTTVANLCVETMADWCSIAIGDESGRYSNLVVAHRDPERVKWAREWNRLHPPRFDAPTGVPQVLRSGKSELYPEITRAMMIASASTEQEIRLIDELKIRSVMLVPMRARGRTLGAITFIASESAYRYTEEDLKLAERLASRAAVAIDNARLYEQARLARAAAETANRAKMDFLAAMSHELRTPINAIAGYTQLLAMGIHGPINAEQQEALARLDRSQKHLLALVEDVLTFARVEAGRMEFEFRETPLATVLRDAADLVVPQAHARNITWEHADVPPELVVSTDPDRLKQIVTNLLTNAVKFTEPGGRIRMSVLEEPDAVSIAVADTGIGIPEDRLESIFEPFVQVEQSQSRRASGMGLGLAISRDLARALGGEILVTSQVGKGSTFTLRLPRAALIEQRT